MTITEEPEAADEEVEEKNSIDSDSNIYAAVEDADGGIQINPNASAVELPEIHDKFAPPKNIQWSNTENTWVVGADVNSPDHNYFTYGVELNNTSITVDARIKMDSTGNTLRFGHGLESPWLDALVVVPRREITECGLDFEISELRYGAEVPALNVVDELSNIEISSENTDRSGSWYHGISNSGFGNRWEIFVPKEETELSADGEQLSIEFTESAIVQSRQSETTPVVYRQDRLFIRGVHSIAAEDVPDVELNDSGTTYVEDTELFAENEMTQ